MAHVVHRRDEMIRRLIFPARGPGGISGVFPPDLRQRCRGNTAGPIPPSLLPQHLPTVSVTAYGSGTLLLGQPQSRRKDGKRETMESPRNNPEGKGKMSRVHIRLYPARRNKDHAVERRRRRPWQDNATQRARAHTQGPKDFNWT